MFGDQELTSMHSWGLTTAYDPTAHHTRLGLNIVCTEDGHVMDRVDNSICAIKGLKIDILAEMQCKNRLTNPNM